MKRHSSFVVKFLQKYEPQCPGIVQAWCSNTNQEKFNLLRQYDETKPKRRATCYILFCIDRRPELQEEHPYMPNKQITSMLATEWRIHRDNKDATYLRYKEQDAKQVFFEKNKHILTTNYPTLSEEEIQLTLDKTYQKLISLKPPSTETVKVQEKEEITILSNDLLE